MDCKILKKTLFISILAISLFYTGEVRALKACSEEVEIYSTPSVTNTSCKITIDKVRQKANFFEFSIGGNVALCMNPGKDLHGQPYVIESIEPISNLWEKRAYAYANATENVSRLAARVAAQTVVWYIEQFGDSVTESDLKNAVCSAFASAKGQCSGVVSASCDTEFEKIKNTTNLIPIYSWRRKDGASGQQRLISQVDINALKTYISNTFGAVAAGNISTDVQATLKEITTTIPGTQFDETKYICEDKCSLTVDSNPADCGDGSFNSTATAGKVFQIATGSHCTEEFDPTNKVTKDGKIEGNLNNSYRSFYQVHCLLELTQQYPGNVSSSIPAGGYLVWPNNGLNENVNKAGLPVYPLSLTYTKKCKMDVFSDDITMDDGTKYEGLKTGFAKVYKVMSDQYNTTNEDEKAGVTDFATHLDCKASNDNKDEKQRAYDTAKGAYDTCYTNNVSNCGTCVDASDLECQSQLNICKAGLCSSEKADMNAASSALEKAKKQLTACTDFKDAREDVMDFVTKWKGIVDYSNNFSNISVSNFGAKINFTYGFENLYGTYKLQKIFNSTSEISVSNSSSRSNMPDDPLSNGSLRQNYVANFNSDVDRLKSEIAKKTAEISKTIKYDLNKKSGLPSRNMSYVKKNTIKSVSSTPSGSYTTIGFVNLPIPFNAELKEYELKLTTEITGSGIPQQIKDGITKNYVCHYTVTNDSPSCICPDNTKMAGMSLESKLSDETTCAEAQALYCDESIPVRNPYVCPTNTKNSGFDLSSCVNSGGTLSSCISQWCNDDKPDLKCPESTNATDGMSKQYRNCVSVKLNQGLNLEQAKAACNVFCTSKGQKIIYRTISLSNPFPSYDSDETVTQNNLTVGMFNDNIKGRYPGMNWNSTTTVKNKILNNRGVDGDKVYTKTPLYTFKLDAGTIQAIRKYNKNHKYSDFTLNCKMGNAAACVSTEFVHKGGYGLVSGTCSGTLTKNNFYTCDA